MQSIYDHDIKINDEGITGQSIIKVSHIGLTALTEIQNLKAIFEKYRLG